MIKLENNDFTRKGIIAYIARELGMAETVATRLADSMLEFHRTVCTLDLSHLRRFGAMTVADVLEIYGKATGTRFEFALSPDGQLCGASESA